jgi:hypothetical protein
MKCREAGDVEARLLALEAASGTAKLEEECLIDVDPFDEGDEDFEGDEP